MILKAEGLVLSDQNRLTERRSLLVESHHASGWFVVLNDTRTVASTTLYLDIGHALLWYLLNDHMGLFS